MVHFFAGREGGDCGPNSLRLRPNDPPFARSRSSAVILIVCQIGPVWKRCAPTRPSGFHLAPLASIEPDRVQAALFLRRHARHPAHLFAPRPTTALAVPWPRGDEADRGPGALRSVPFGLRGRGVSGNSFWAMAMETEEAPHGTRETACYPGHAARSVAVRRRCEDGRSTRTARWMS